MKIKVCGMRNPENIEAITLLPIDFIGFIFYPKSKRDVGEDFDPKIMHSIPKNIKKVGVFVNESFETILKKSQKYQLDYIQLHGTESIEMCQKLKNQHLGIIKVFGIGDSFDFSMLNGYKPYCNYFLFDTKTPEHGGSGQKFSWDLLRNYDNEIPLFLSGGIGKNDAEDIKKLDFLNLETLDINSKFEIAPALKNADDVRFFLKSLSVL